MLKHCLYLLFPIHLNYLQQKKRRKNINIKISNMQKSGNHLVIEFMQ